MDEMRREAERAENGSGQEDNELKKREVLRMSNQESHRLTLECIQSALLYLMGTKSYDRITITEIIKRSGVSRAAFYRNYSGKDQVLRDALTGVTEFLQEIFAGSIVGDDTEKSLVRFFEEIRRNRKEVELLLKAELNVKQIFDSLPERRNPDNPMEEYRTGIYICSLWAVVEIWSKNDFRETPEALASFLTDIFVV